MKINYIEKPHTNNRTHGTCCRFEHNGEKYYADKSFVGGFFSGYETMIFKCEDNGKVSDWGELYCDTSGKTLEQCIEEFISNQ